MIAKLINKKNFLTMPWANGLGVTTELYVHKNQQTDRMLWRISIAGVDTDGPFSHFDGYDRILILLQGAGLTLTHANGKEHRLSLPYDVAVFPGDVATFATLVDGPIKDFNIIADRMSFAQTAVVLPSGVSNSAVIDADYLAIYALDTELRIVDHDIGAHTIPPGDLLVADAPTKGNWTFSGGRAIVTQLHGVT